MNLNNFIIHFFMYECFNGYLGLTIFLVGLFHSNSDNIICGSLVH